MIDNANIKTENAAYWSRRSAGYSEVNRTELSGISLGLWKETLRSAVSGHFPDRAPGTIEVLDIGTGPGFFAIVLAELGYKVTAAGLTPEMLKQARMNAGIFAEKISFRIADAEALDIPDASFDVVVSRNLTWNLPDPRCAYTEWRRVLRPGGLMLNFDSNWYNYLFDEDARAGYEADRASSEALGLGDQNVAEDWDVDFDIMEEIARKMPLSRVKRPEWDLEVLTGLGMEVSVDEKIWEKVWTKQEQVNFASTPMFMIHAVKR